MPGTTVRIDDLRADLVAMHGAALAAAEPAAAVERALAFDGGIPSLAGEPLARPRAGRLLLVAAGKAALGMAAGAAGAAGAARALASQAVRIDAAVVVHPLVATPVPRDPPGLARLPPNTIRIAASHPLPDENSLRAGAAVRNLLAGARRDDLVLVLLSGGASSLLELLLPGVTLDVLRRVTRALQRAGADVVELNTVRRALSAIKGGGLARLALPAKVATLAISDVVGDRPEAIGSGPTVPSPTGPDEALAILRRFGVDAELPEIVSALSSAARASATPSGDAAPFRIVASNRLAAEAALEAARGRGFDARLLTTHLQGEAREVGRLIGGFARSVSEQAVPLAAPACLIFGGETTVTVRGAGRGGRNQELALGAAFALAGCDRAAVLSFATDGVDGSSDAAGALATGDTLARAAAAGLSPHRALAESDGDSFFRALGDLWFSGPTGTNVNDLAIVLVYP